MKEALVWAIVGAILIVLLGLIGVFNLTPNEPASSSIANDYGGA